MVIGYSLVNGVLKIEEIWLNKVWELCCSSTDWALKLQVKRGMIYNIRPCNLTGISRFNPFSTREEFLHAIQSVLHKYSQTQNNYSNWKINFLDKYNNL